jgi:hypothetical protein
VDQEIKTLWVEALRSGYYKQGKNVLKDNNRYCCLGVLKHLIEGDFEGRQAYYDDAEAIGLTLEVQEKLAVMNDGDGDYYYRGRKSFTQIADYIERNL